MRLFFRCARNFVDSRLRCARYMTKMTSAQAIVSAESGLPALGSVQEIMRLYMRGDGLSLADALALEAEHTVRRTFDAKSFGELGTATAKRASQKE